MGRKTLYDESTFPLLAEGYARDGLTDELISKKLGIGKATFYEYENRYPEFRDALKKGKAPVDIQVENALLKRALGYEYIEKQSVMKISDKPGTKDDEKGTAKPVEIRTTTKVVLPDTTAQIFWLKNRKPKVWRDVNKIGVDDNFDWGDIIRAFSGERAKLQEDLKQKEKDSNEVT